MNTTAKMEILFFHQKQNDAKKKGEKTPHTGIKIFRSQVVLIRMKCIMVLIIINIYLQTTRRKKRTQQTKPTRNCYDTHTHIPHVGRQRSPTQQSRLSGPGDLGEQCPLSLWSPLPHPPRPLPGYTGRCCT